MALYRQRLEITTRGRGCHEITPLVAGVATSSGLAEGLCHLFLRHTSASLILCENADPVVREDLERFMAGLVPDGDPRLQHVMEGPDDMPAHIRSILTHNDLTIPLERGRLLLGTWQGIYLWEHRQQGHRREVVVTVVG